MPRGSNPNSRKNLKKGCAKTQFTAENAVDMQKKSTEAKLAYKSMRDDLKERCTPERVARMNERMISMAEHGNIQAWQRILEALGEDPAKKVELSGAGGKILEVVWVGKKHVDSEGES